MVACDQQLARLRARTRREEAQARDGIVSERGVNIAASANNELIVAGKEEKEWRLDYRRADQDRKGFSEGILFSDQTKGWPPAILEFPA